MKVEFEINDKLIAFIKQAFSGKKLAVMFLLAILLTSIIVYSAVKKPHTFSKGQVISASHINENFEYMRLKLEEMESVIQGVPVETVVPFAGDGSSIPAGWLLCNGDPVSRTEYSKLFYVIRTK